MEELSRTDENVVVHFWVEGGDPNTFEGALAADPTVADADELTKTETRRLYRATCTDYGRSIITFPSWSELDVSFLEATATGEGWAVECEVTRQATSERLRRATGNLVATTRVPKIV